MTVEVRRAGERFRAAEAGLESWRSFSFGVNYDPGNVGFGMLVAHNEDVVVPGTGYGKHPHSDLEIVTWVLSGSLIHADSAGHGGEIHPGLAQRMSAGSGVEHSEVNNGLASVHFVQMWVRPDEFGLTPSYAQRDVSADLATGELALIASGRPGSAAAIPINQPAAEFHAARLEPGTSVSLPPAPLVHAFIATGTASLDDTAELGTGDATRIRADDGHRLTAGPTGAEVLVWAFTA